MGTGAFVALNGGVTDTAVLESDPCKVFTSGLAKLVEESNVEVLVSEDVEETIR